MTRKEAERLISKITKSSISIETQGLECFEETVRGEVSRNYGVSCVDTVTGYLFILWQMSSDPTKRILERIAAARKGGD